MLSCNERSNPPFQRRRCTQFRFYLQEAVRIFPSLSDSENGAGPAALHCFWFPARGENRSGGPRRLETRSVYQGPDRKSSGSAQTEKLHRSPQHASFRPKLPLAPFKNLEAHKIFLGFFALPTTIFPCKSAYLGSWYSFCFPCAKWSRCPPGYCRCRVPQIRRYRPRCGC